MRSPESVERLVQPLCPLGVSLSLHNPEMPVMRVMASYRNSHCGNSYCGKSYC
jgi:hypothetical protein